VFVAALALLLDRALEKSWRAAGSRLSTPFVWQALEMIRCVEVDLGPAPENLRDPRQPACGGSTPDSGHYSVGSASSPGGSAMAHVVTQTQKATPGFIGLQATMANMR